MQPNGTGVILFVEAFEACVAFYRDQIGLAVIEAQESLVNFSFGSSYLMIERGGVASKTPKSRQMNPTVLRFDVPDVAETAKDLRARNVPVEIRTFEWGTIGVFFDPDFNRCGLKQLRGTGSC